MTIEVTPSKNYPGRVTVSHRLHEDSNMTTMIELTDEDVESLRAQLDRMGL